MTLTVSSIRAAAEAQTGLTVIGDERILEGLAVLVDALNNEARLCERGEGMVAQNLAGNLARRMKVEDWLKRHPELLDRPIEKPLFVFGLPRTGTTLVINLLAEDPARRCFLRWEAFDPVPPPRPEELHAGPRYDAQKAQLDMAFKVMPHIAAIHHEDADSPTECQFSMSPSFCAEVFDSQYHIPSYRKWLFAADYRPAFDFHKRFLQHLQAEAGGRWTLKNPWHPLWLDTLIETYPDAQLVMTHRDPVSVVGSACSLLRAVRPMFTEHVDPIAIGETLLQTFDLMLERVAAYRAKHGADAIHDLSYKRLMADPMGEIRAVYDRFGEPLSPEAEARMVAYLDRNPKGKHGKHEYALEDYGLTADRIRARYGDYARQYCE